MNTAGPFGSFQENDENMLGTWLQEEPIALYIDAISQKFMLLQCDIFHAGCCQSQMAPQFQITAPEKKKTTSDGSVWPARNVFPFFCCEYLPL